MAEGNKDVNLTVIIIILVGIIIAVAAPIITGMLKKTDEQKCIDKGGVLIEGKCER